MRPASPAAFRKSRLPSSSPTAHRLSAKYQSDQTGRPSIVATCAQPDNDTLRHPSQGPAQREIGFVFSPHPCFPPQKAANWVCLARPPVGQARNPNVETRNKPEGPKPKIPNPLPSGDRVSVILIIRNSNLFRISHFVLRVCRSRTAPTGRSWPNWL